MRAMGWFVKNAGFDRSNDEKNMLPLWWECADVIRAEKAR
jgi:hypothetical protein